MGCCYPAGKQKGLTIFVHLRAYLFNKRFLWCHLLSDLNFIIFLLSKNTRKLINKRVFLNDNDKYQSIKLSCKLKLIPFAPSKQVWVNQCLIVLYFRPHLSQRKIKDVLVSAKPKKSFDNKVARVGWGSCRFQLPQRETPIRIAFWQFIRSAISKAKTDSNPSILRSLTATMNQSDREPSVKIQKAIASNV